jgi:hypothetical protein
MNALTRTLLGSIVIGFALHASAAPEVTGTVNITGNKAKNITTGGGNVKASGIAGKLIGASANMNGVANMNSVVLNDGKISGKVNVTGNTAEDVKAIGGTANVNSLVLGK